MYEPSSSEQKSETATDGVLHDDNGDAIGTRQFFVDEGLAAASTDGLSQAFAVLTPTEIAESLQNRTFIEQAKGMLMFIYDVDDHHAFELLKWRSQDAGVKLRQLSERLVEELAATARDQPSSLRSVCDELLRTVPEWVAR